MLAEGAPSTATEGCGGGRAAGFDLGKKYLAMDGGGAAAAFFPFLSIRFPRLADGSAAEAAETFLENAEDTMAALDYDFANDRAKSSNPLKINKHTTF